MKHRRGTPGKYVFAHAVVPPRITAGARPRCRLAGSRKPGWERRYLGHVYFTYISLWVGFVIVPALGSPNPGVWIPVAVVSVLTAGTMLIHRYEQRLGLRPSP